jgi:hypothetical protein
MKGLHPENREPGGSHFRLLCGADIPPFLAEHSPVTMSLILLSRLRADTAHFLKTVSLTEIEQSRRRRGP